MHDTQQSPEVFWRWFAEAEPDIRAGFEQLKQLSIKAPKAELEAGLARAETLMGRLSTAIHAFDRRIHPFGGAGANGVISLTFTAEGDRDVFPRIFELVGKAPKLEGWQFIPLKPAQPHGGVQASGVTLDFSEIEYLLAREDGETDVLLVVDHDVTSDLDLYDFLAHLAIEAQLGEYGCATHLDTIAITNRHDIDPDWLDDLKPIRALVDEFPKELPN